MRERAFQVVQVSPWELHGGIGRIADYLHQAYKARGIKSTRAVGRKDSDDPDVWQIAAGEQGIAQLLALPLNTIIHLHAPDSWKFELGALPALTACFQVVLHLHDAWLLSGGCSHSLDCEAWESGCDGAWCPPMGCKGSLYPLMATPLNKVGLSWRVKRRIFEQSPLYITTACHWLMDKVGRSILGAAMVETQVIPHGVDSAVFQPGDKGHARAELGLPQDELIVLSVNQGEWRDYALAGETMKRLRKLRPMPFLLGVGGGMLCDNPDAHVLFTGEVPPERMPLYYQASDVYLHPAAADTFPNVVLEALASGLPVVATAVGGIPEQVEHQQTGLLLAPSSPRFLAWFVSILLLRADVRKRMGEAAVEQARSRFGLDRMADAFVKWYEHIYGRSERNRKVDRRSKPRRWGNGLD